MKQNAPILLASGSPRRRELLGQLGLSFTVRAPEVEELVPPNIPPLDTATYLAELKADASIEQLRSDQRPVIITADTIVLVDDMLLGKPQDAGQARRMLELISGRSHRVITGFCIVTDTGKKISASCTTEVELAELSSSEIEYYITDYQPFDKAGAYGIQEWLGRAKVLALRGSYSNVMGLPTAAVYRALCNLGVVRF